jgi:hypothetical protein
MKKLLPLAVIAAAAIAIPAYAAKPANPGSQGKGHTKSHHNSSQRCKHSTLTKAYVFGGTLTGNPTVTQTAGQATPSTADDVFNVGATFTVTHANKYAKGDHAKGSTFSTPINGVAVNFAQNADGTQHTPQTGDHVNVKGRRAFKVKSNCQANPNAAVGSVTYKKVGFGS